jgi:hypothetical protein
MRKLWIFLVLTAVATAEAQFNWSFTDGSEGWVVADLHTGGPYHPPMATYSVSHSSSGGCPGGYISRVDPSANSYAFSLPVEQLPDGQDWVGGRLDFCLRSTHATWTSEAFVLVVGGDGTVLRAPISLPAPTWSSYEVDLIPASFQTMAGATPSALQFQGVMAQVEALYILAEFGAQVQETSALDEVHLHLACPEALVAPALTILSAGTQEDPVVELAWDSVLGARHYALYEWQSQAWVLLATPLATQFTLPVAGDRLGRYQVRAICD